MADGVIAGPWFAWERTNRGPRPVKYHDGITKAQHTEALATYQIAKTELLESFGALSKKYPPPAPGPEDLWQTKQSTPTPDTSLPTN